jgi:hypothetical protein
MYKFITISGSCGGEYDLKKCEDNANKMLQQGYELVQVYQTRTSACLGGSNSALVMVFKQI